MASNVLNTRIRSKIDYLKNWNNSSEGASPFVPYLGEICIAIIPRNIDATNISEIDSGISQNDPIGIYGRESQPRNGVGLTPYAIGMKVGDGINTFVNLPWIQALAGDVYAWAKKSQPEASDVKVTYNNNNSDVQTAITGIEESLGNLVVGNVDPADLGAALAQLTQQLSGAEGTLFDSNYTIPQNEQETPQAIPTQIIRKIEQNGLSLSVTGSALSKDDLPDIPFNKITGVAFSSGHNYNGSTNPIATQSYVKSEIDSIKNQITGGMSFLGIVHETDLLAANSNKITDGTNNVAPIIRTGENITETIPIADLMKGNVIVYIESVTTIDETTQTEITVDAESISKEFIWTGTAWELLGDESSFAVKGSIEKTDLSSELQTEINNKLTATQADLNAKLSSSDAENIYVRKNGTDRLMTATEGEKLTGIAVGAQVNVIEKVQVNGTDLTITDKSVNVEVPILKIKQKSTTGPDINITPDANDKSITLAPIAFDGDVKNLKQTDTVLVFNCGSASILIDNENTM